MSQVIYRKYRARSFAEIVGQAQIVASLTQSIQTQQFSHAYLLSGPRGTGKTSVARLIAKAMNCEQFAKDGDVCGKCDQCLQIEKGAFVDLIEIDAASNRGIEEVRKLKENINFLPSQGAFKVYIIDEAHMLTKEAFNALLKTLEEPPAHAVFVLATTEVYKVPLTILSRVQRFDFKLASKQELSSKLTKIAKAEGRELNDDALETLFQLSGGSFRDAETLLHKVFSANAAEKPIDGVVLAESLGLVPAKLVQNFVDHLLGKDINAGLLLLDEIVVAGFNPGQLMTQLVQALRQQVLDKAAADLSYAELLGLLKALLRLQSEIKYMDDPLLLLQILLLEQNAGATAPQAATPAKTHTTKTPPADPTTSVPVTAEPAANVEPEPATDAMPIAQQEIELWSRVLRQAKQQSIALWTLLKPCELKLENGIYAVVSRVNGNLMAIKANGSLVMLQEIMASVLGQDSKWELQINPEIVEEVVLPSGNSSMVEQLF